MSSTVHNQFIQGIPCLIPNRTTDAKSKENYYVSYNNYDTAIYGSDTTAVVIGGMSRFYILNGDHRKAFESAANWQECLNYLLSNADKLNFRSEHLPQAGKTIEEICAVSWYAEHGYDAKGNKISK